ncbi:hypothetical protein MHYP_G00145590 [Metynnis hypsauchen]
MISSALLLLLLTAFSGVDSVELTQPASKVVKPGESFSISCKISESSYCINWIRQPAGKALELLGYLCSGGSTNIKDTVKSKISFSQDKSSSTVFLQGQNFQSEDTAVYYCARDPQRYNHPADLNKNTLNILNSSLLTRCVHCIELTQPGSMTINTGQSITLTCKVSGYSLTDSSYCTDWIRQPAGKALEWISTICGNGAKDTKASLKSKFSISKDSSTVTLSGQNLQTEDSAVYYCARRPHTVMKQWGSVVQKLNKTFLCQKASPTEYNVASLLRRLTEEGHGF